MSAPSIRGLVVGIDHYLGSPKYPTLSGAVRDAVRMKRLLEGRFEVAAEHIECLLASPDIPPERQPTYRHLVQALDRLVGQAQAGEQIFIHYSGHGARVPTARVDLKGPGGFDECLVPCDIGRGESRYIRDLEIAALLDRMVARGAFVTLVLDACHSGGATRGPAKARGLADGLILPKPRDTPLASTGAIDRAFERRRARAKGARPQKGWVPMPEGYVCLAACGSAELAYEYPFDGQFSGALSHWLLALLKASSGVTYRQLFERVARRVRHQFEMQNPQLEGEADRMFFGREASDEHRSGLSILELDRQRRRVRIAAGRAHGIGQGARLRLEPADIEVRVIETEATTSWAEVDSDVRLDHLSLDDRVRVLETGRSGALRVGVTTEGGLSSELCKAIWTSLQQRGEDSLRWVGSNEAPDLLLAAESGVLELCDPAGVALPFQEPRLTAEVASVPHLVQRLSHLARYGNVRDLENPDPVVYLRAALCVELGKLEPDYQARERPRPEPATLAPSHAVEVGQWLCLRLENSSSLVLHVAVLDLQPDWGISQVFPAATAAPCFELEPGAEHLLPLRAALPAGCARGHDVLAVLATIAPTDFRCLELPTLAEVKPHRIVRPVTPRNGFEAYLASLTDRPVSFHRSQRPDPYAGRDWITAQVTVDIQRSGKAPSVD